MRYKQFCPIAKASELVGEKWTFLLIRELAMGGSRFSDFQKGMKQISPTMLSKRLNDLAENGLVERRKIPDQSGYEYFLSPAGKELFPVVLQLGEWGMRWARGQMADDDLDVELLILYLSRSIKPDNLGGNETTIQFNFTDLDKLSKWWLVVKQNDVDVCLDDPGREVSVWFTTDLRTMTQIWMGDCSYKAAINDKRLILVGPARLTRNVENWMSSSIFAGTASAQSLV
ncbi:MAG: helix-turn-helix domain-containing protein [Gammaproteobacteria bacterium]|nr:helix-turn-helix domain-containing protein [Gammaproteobacteria bacterium]